MLKAQVKEIYMDVTAIFGSMVFNDAVMKQRLSKSTYNDLIKCIEEDKSLTMSIASEVAAAMKDWAIEHGCTHFCHWFQPMTGVTAEKHDAFISPAKGGGVITEFSGKELIKGEPDASSFPSGGLRATFEARGYTAWDPTSYAFIKDATLCIPTAFCSYGGQALDKKTPLLRSMQAIDLQARRVLRLFGKKVAKVTATVGPEQEYFLIDQNVYAGRKDLIYTGRTLIGAPPPKGQEMEDHYFGVIKTRVSEFMKDLDTELWKLGIYAKTKHNEVAPAQHELAPVFTSANIATDHNQLTMEVMKKTAARHGMVCLLHEKPFKGVNGSGKHDNWSLSTDSGENLLDPGSTPEDNAQFLLFLSAVIKAVDEYQDLLRTAVASAGNDHRLGAGEAPPAIVSIFLGEELDGILRAIAEDRPYSKRAGCEVEVGVKVLPHFPKDTTDRNRTSPFAFTGNKFEFRMLGSNASIAGPNIILNTIVSEALSQFCERLESADDFISEVTAIIKDTVINHGRIIFNGNNYSDEWLKEAKKRGLHNLASTPEALPHFKDERNIEVFEKHRVFTREEVITRTEIMLDNYCKSVHIEALTLAEMLKQDIMPAVSSYIGAFAKSAFDAKKLIQDIDLTVQQEQLSTLNKLYADAYRGTQKLDNAIKSTEKIVELEDKALSYRNKVIVAMEQVREATDKLESIVGSEFWPVPTYGDILFSVK